MNSFRILLCLLLTVIILATQAACGGTGTDGAASSAPSDEKFESTAAPAAGEVKGEVANITYWEMMWGPADSYTAAVEKLVEKFNSSQSAVKVKVQMTPWDNFYQTFLTAVTSGAAPDVSTGAFPQAIQYAKMGEILSLDPIIEQWTNEKNPILEDFIPGSIDLLKYDGKQVGMPWNADPRQIVYRKDIFEQAGITKMPETWNEFLDVCRTIKSKTDVVPLVFAAADQMGTQNLLNFMFTNNIGITDKDLNPTFEDAKVVETLQFISTLYNEKLIPEGTVSYKGADSDKVFYSGKAAMYLGGVPNDILGNKELDGKCAILPPFAGPSGEKHALTWLNSMMAYKQTKSPEASQAFVKWWAENNLPLWTEGKCGPLPARQLYLKDPYFTANWLSRELGEVVIPYAVSPVWPASSLYPEFSQIEGENYLAIAMQDVLSGKTDYAAITKNVNDKIRKALGK